MSAPPWLLLRGLMRETRHWGDFPQRLAEATQAAVFALDLPGNGLRSREASPNTVGAMAADIAAQWQRLNGGPVRVLALSLGGMVAVEWARQAPNTVTGLVLCNTSMRPHGAPWQRFSLRAVPSLLRLLVSAPDAAVVEADILRLTSNRAEDHAPLVADWAQWRRQCPVAGRNVLRQLTAAARYRADDAPTVPTRVLCSASDRLVSSACSERLAAAWQVPIAMHPDAGHDLPLDAPDWVIGELRRASRVD